MIVYEAQNNKKQRSVRYRVESKYYNNSAWAVVGTRKRLWAAKILARFELDWSARVRIIDTWNNYHEVDDNS
jgi:hypothetical protein